MYDWSRNDWSKKMDNENNGSEPAGQNEAISSEDGRIKNLQAEMNRKTSNLDSKLEQINQQLQQLSLLGNNIQTPQNINTNTRPDPMLEPEAYERYIEQKMEARLNDRFSIQQKQQSEIAGLVSNFPELSDGSSELSQAAVRAYNNLSPQEKAAPGAYKLAVQGAALELGILPKSKRSENSKPKSNESDDIGARGSNEGRNSGSRNKSQKLDDSTLEFARLLGKDVNDPKYVERLQKAATRTRWSKAQNRNEY